LTLAIWSKYPNPHSSHVVTSDVVDRYVDPRTGYLYTTRLFLKRGNIPKWGRKVIVLLKIKKKKKKKINK